MSILERWPFIEHLQKGVKEAKEPTLGVHFSAVPLREMIGTQCHTTLPVLKQGKLYGIF